MKKMQYNNEDAVSPVIGVMLMLVVTVILAAAVSSYAGGMGGNMQKAPQLTMDVSIQNTGDWKGSQITFNVMSVSEPIPTKDLKIITSWTNSTGVLKGATMTAWDGTSYNTNYTYSTTNYLYQSPIGYGRGVNSASMNTSGGYPQAQFFGEYTLIPGTTMKNSPESTYKNFAYSSSTGTDGIEAILGVGWEELRTGDIVNVKIIHTPSGKVIYESDVGVD
ncbi:MAG: archaeal type pilus assembly protein PilA [Methanolobus sp.]|jgi:FlaG/FlaF family flagellin (archaellin)|nr:archaeal type pilus assembly protein PilA [Methanolobus sp.]MDK2834189.1 archaeal type pilus assembly protein PilA [Methanolobus sp.]